MRWTRLSLTFAAIAGALLFFSPPAISAPVVVPAVAPGYKAGVYLEGLRDPTAMTFGTDGRLYVAELRGNISAAEGTDAAGHAVRSWVFSTGQLGRGFFGTLGLAFRGSDLYVSANNRIFMIPEAAGQERGYEPVTIISELHVQGQHQNDNIAFGPDGKLYIGVGGVNNVGRQPHPFNGSILQANPDGTDLRVYASGMRNPFGLAFDSGGRLWATDNGADPPAVIDPPDKLNLILEGRFYGFPDQYMGSSVPWEPPVVQFPAHASADTMTFYTASLMPELKDQALVVFYGPEYAARPEANPKLVRVQLVQQGDRWSGSWATLAEHFDRPLTVAVGPDGRIFVGDMTAGAVYWIAPASWQPSSGAGEPASTDTPGGPPNDGTENGPPAGEVPSDQVPVETPADSPPIEVAPPETPAGVSPSESTPDASAPSDLPVDAAPRQVGSSDSSGGD